MTDIASVNASVDAFIANVKALIAQHQMDVSKAIAEAIAQDDAEEAIDLSALKDKVDAANAALVIPPFEPSANA